MKRAWSVTELEQRLGLSEHAPLRLDASDRVPLVLSQGWVMVTGANGLLGRHLIRELLRRGGSVLAPVRAADRQQARQRLEVALTRAPTFVWPEDRLTVIPWGSLDRWDSQGRPLEGVCHSAADLSLAQPVGALWETNVQMTRTLVAFARRHRARRFDHVSTLSVWVAGETPPGRCHEDEDLRRAGVLHGGYAASKWAAERVLPHAVNDLPTAVHRLGLLTVGPSEGWQVAHDPVAATAAAWARWGNPGTCPADADAVAFDWSPVDTVAQALVDVMCAGGLGAFHHAAQTPVTGAQWWAAQDRGQPSEPWPQHDPLGRMARRALGRWLQSGRQGWWMDLFQSSHHSYDTTRAQACGVVPWHPPETLPRFEFDPVLR